SASESAASGLPEYDPSGGLLGGGVVLGARYLFNERWGLEGEASWERLLNDAADSPITALGSEDQYEVRLNLTRRISLDF
ncbi:MAG: MipA/OmpV family protein, partial [Rhodobacteraceae bacterium]|nr:MipA/OmpV family protein [Paracoccaceae bacterium]